MTPRCPFCSEDLMAMPTDHASVWACSNCTFRYVPDGSETLQEALDRVRQDLSEAFATNERIVRRTLGLGPKDPLPWEEKPDAGL